jgi:regulatory protein
MLESNRGESPSRKRRKPKTEGEDSPRSLSPERQEQRARNVLLHQLSRSAKTAKQCRDILAKREIDAEIAESVIQRYIEVGLIDDHAVAQTIANSRRKYKGLAKSAIKRELNEKGISADLIELSVAEFDSESELRAATELALKRMPRLASLERDVRQRRLTGYLARKGYGSSQIIAAIKVAEAELALQG